MKRTSSQSSARVVRLVDSEPATVVPLLDRLAHRSAGAASHDAVPATPAPWMGSVEKPAVRSLFAPPPPEPVVAAPVGNPLDAPEVQLQLQELRAHAEQEGWRAGQQQVDAVCESYVEAVARLEQTTREAARPSSEEVVSLALVVARELLGRELRIDREAIVAAVDEALHQAGREAPVRIRLARADLDFLSRKRRDLLDGGIQFIEDNTLQPGGCIVETARRVVDATVEARLEAVRASLIAVLNDPGAAVEPERERIQMKSVGSAA